MQPGGYRRCNYSELIYNNILWKNAERVKHRNRRFFVLRKGIVLVIMMILLFTGCAGADGNKLPIDLSPGSAYSGQFESGSDQVYEDPTIRVERHKIESASDEFNCWVWYAIITIADPSQLRTYPANGSDFCKTTRTTIDKLSKRVRAVLAINGDYPVAFSGNASVSYVLRQGEVYRDSVAEGLDILLIDEDGDFHVLTRDEDLAGIDKTQIDGKKVINAFQFGPALIIDGKPVDDETLLDKSHSPTHAEPHSKHQRMVFCQIDTLKYMAVCVANWGATLPTMRDLVLYLAPECRVAYTLDGGESTQMTFLGRIFNNTGGSNADPRPLADIIYFASAQ